MTWLLHRNFTPSNNEPSVVVVLERSTFRSLRSITTNTAKIRAEAAFRPYTSVALRYSAMTKTPNAGPRTEASCQEPLSHVTAFSNEVCGSSWGSRVDVQ